MDKIYIFQDWQLGELINEENGKNYYNSEKIKKALSEEDVCKHCDITWNQFCFLSLDKSKLIEFANKRKEEYIGEYYGRVNYLNSMDYK